MSLLAVSALVAVPVLAACDTSPGAAAIIGSDHITTAHLFAEVNAQLADPNVKAALANPQYSTAIGGDQLGFTRDTLARMIDENLVSKVAAAHHVTVTPAEVASETSSFEQQSGSLSALQQSAAQQVGVGAKELPDLIRFTVLQQKLATALTANLTATPAQLQQEYQKDIDQYDQLDVAEIAVSSKKLADTILTKVRNKPSSFASLARKDSLDTATKAKGGAVGLVPRSQVVTLLGSASKAKPGSFQVAHSSSQWVVLHIIKRQLTPLSAVTQQVKTALFSSQSQALLSKAVTSEGSTLGVHVNPRFGTWNNAEQSVVATKSSTSATG